MSNRFTEGSILSIMSTEPGWRMRIKGSGEVVPVIAWAVVVAWCDYTMPDNEANIETHVEPVVLAEGEFLLPRYWMKADAEDGDLLSPGGEPA